jgi:hypothetical protein
MKASIKLIISMNQLVLFSFLLDGPLPEDLLLSGVLDAEDFVVLAVAAAALFLEALLEKVLGEAVVLPTALLSGEQPAAGVALRPRLAVHRKVSPQKALAFEPQRTGVALPSETADRQLSLLDAAAVDVHNSNRLVEPELRRRHRRIQPPPKTHARLPLLALRQPRVQT